MADSEKISNKNPFSVPEGYFNEVNRKILAATSEKTEGKPERKTNMSLMLRPYLAVAASLAILVVVGWLSLRILNNEDKPAGLSDLAGNTELLLNEIDLVTLETTAAEAGIFDEPVQNDELIEMILIENVDLDDIYEKL
jgi:hypothetical protein